MVIINNNGNNNNSKNKGKHLLVPSVCQTLFGELLCIDIYLLYCPILIHITTLQKKIHLLNQYLTYQMHSMYHKLCYKCWQYNNEFITVEEFLPHSMDKETEA